MTTHARDQVSYTTTTVEAFLPAVWDEDYVPPMPLLADSGIKQKVDPRHIPDWLLSRSDVQVGYRRGRLTHEEKECLRHVHHLGFAPGELASVWSVQPEQIHHACMAGIQKISDYLSGRTPA